MHIVTMKIVRFLNGRDVSYTTSFLAKVDAAEALARHNAGESLRQIAASLGPDVSYVAVWRAVQRAKRLEEVSAAQS